MTQQTPPTVEALAREVAKLHEMTFAHEVMLNAVLLTIALTPSQSGAIDRLLRDQANRMRKLGHDHLAARLLEKRQLILKTGRTMLASKGKV